MILDRLLAPARHARRRRLVGLLAASALEGAEREEALVHLASCPRCREGHAEVAAVVAAMEADPVRDAEPPVPVAVLVRRVEREVEGAITPAGRPRRWLVAVPVAAAALAAAVVVPSLVSRLRTAPEAARAEIPPADASPLLTEDALARIERNLAREHAVRYLSEASEVLVSVAASGTGVGGDGRLDVGAAPQRSRSLLERRALVVRQGGEAVASARGVLDEVELALRDVAELPSLARREDVERLRGEVERRQLLMRIRLMTRELEG